MKKTIQLLLVIGKCSEQSDEQSDEQSSEERVQTEEERV